MITYRKDNNRQEYLGASEGEVMSVNKAMALVCVAMLAHVMTEWIVFGAHAGVFVWGYDYMAQKFWRLS